MEIIDNKYLAVKTRNPDKILNAVEKSQVVHLDGDVSTVAVPWDLPEAQQLRRLKIKNVPSPIRRDYQWPGLYTPMSHQLETAEFLTLHPRSYCFNEAGVGKTASCIWAADYLINQGYIRRVLIVCPLSIMQAAWERDLFNVAPHRRVGVAHGNADRRRDIVNSNVEFVVINYDGVEIILEELMKGRFDLVIIDEASSYKNSKTDKWKAMNKLIRSNPNGSAWLWMLTGTPAANSPLEAYGLGKLCVPERVPRFMGTFRDMVMQNTSRFRWVPKPHAYKIVHGVLQPAIRFEKKDCLDLPDVTYVDRDAPLTAQQWKYYEKLRKEKEFEAAGVEISSANEAILYSQLLQISGGAIYTPDKQVIHFDVSDRLNVIEEIINESSQKVIIFVPFIHTVHLLNEFLIKQKIPCEMIYGDVSAKKRNDIINRFQTTPISALKVLILQPDTAAHGITLTAANVAIWYSPVSQPETYIQAVARIDRQGQRNPMTVVHIVGSPKEREVYQSLWRRYMEHRKVTGLYMEKGVA